MLQSPAEELEALKRRMQMYSKLQAYRPLGLEAVITAVRERGRRLAERVAIAERLECAAARLPRRARSAG